MEAIMSSLKKIVGASQSQLITGKLKGSIYKKLEKSMKTLPIKFEKLKNGKQIGYMAVVKELGNSMIMADSLAELFEQLPIMIESCEKNQIGIFGNPKVKN